MLFAVPRNKQQKRKSGNFSLQQPKKEGKMRVGWIYSEVITEPSRDLHVVRENLAAINYLNGSLEKDVWQVVQDMRKLGIHASCISQCLYCTVFYLDQKTIQKWREAKKLLTREIDERVEMASDIIKRSNILNQAVYLGQHFLNEHSLEEISHGSCPECFPRQSSRKRREVRDHQMRIGCRPCFATAIGGCSEINRCAHVREGCIASFEYLRRKSVVESYLKKIKVAEEGKKARRKIENVV